MISRKVKAMDVSGVRAMFEMASKIESPIDLTIGIPKFDVPEELKEEAIKAIREGFNRYTETKGLYELRKKIAEKLRIRNDIYREPDSIIVTSAASGALTLAFSSILDKGDEIIIFDPYFVAYKQLALLNESIPVFVKTNDDFSININNLKNAITSKTKAIMINTPSNPTGYVYTNDELIQIAEIAKRNNIIIISDEIYEDFIYDMPHFSIGSIYENTISIFGFSKSFAMTGWRIGYMTGPKEIIEQSSKVSQFIYVCAPAPFQYAAIKALDFDLKDFIAKYKIKRDIIYDSLKDSYNIIRPNGAFYAFIEYPYEPKRFIDDCIKNKLLIVPGNIFSEADTHFRISFSNNDDILHKAVKIFNNIFNLSMRDSNGK